jgi:hypothetical protein
MFKGLNASGGTATTHISNTIVSPHKTSITDITILNTHQFLLPVRCKGTSAKTEKAFSAF